MDIVSLIKKATTVPRPPRKREVDDEISQSISNGKNNVNNDNLLIPTNIIEAIKRCCRDNGDDVREAAHYLLIDATESKSHISRLRALNVIDTLFNRSKEFRTIISARMKDIARSAGLLKCCSDGVVSGCVSSSSTTSPKALCFTREHAKIVEEKVKLYIELWDIRFGALYPSLRAVSRYFKESLHLG